MRGEAFSGGSVIDPGIPRYAIDAATDIELAGSGPAGVEKWPPVRDNESAT